MECTYQMLVVFLECCGHELRELSTLYIDTMRGKETHQGYLRSCSMGTRSKHKKKKLTHRGLFALVIIVNHYK